jgi:hypothetical protein
METTMICRSFPIAIAVVYSLTGSVGAEQVLQTAPPIQTPNVEPSEMKLLADPYPKPNLPDRISFSVGKTQRGTTLEIKEEVVIKFCSGMDGCTVRLGMHNWDDTGRVASREFLFFYNKDTGAWRSSSDAAGANNNNVTEHAYQAWSCYFTDGQYLNWQNKGDPDKSFGLLSWNEYNADCFITFIK